MFCNMTRWFISREVDRGKKTPRLALRHAERCGACRAYARFAASLPSQFAGERPAFLASVPDFPLNEMRWAEDRGVREKRGIREPGPSAQDEAAALTALKTVTAAPDEFQGMVGEVESALTKERQILEKSVVSAVEYLQARLNIRIVKKETPRSL
jgi:hypothetical protein